MPETYDQVPKTKSVYDGEAEKKKNYAKLGARITDNVPHKLFGLKTTDEEYWGLREVLTEDEVAALGNRWLIIIVIFLLYLLRSLSAIYPFTILFIIVSNIYLIESLFCA